MNKNTYISVGIVIVLIIVIWMVFSVNNKNAIPKLNYDDFAKCLASKDVTMYGAAWCTHCQAQKALFGSSFQYVKYVECPDNINICLAKGINGYPTWIFADGLKVEGETTLANIAKISGCALPI